MDAATPDFAAFVDAQAKLGIENIEGVSVFAFVCIDDMAKIRKALKDDLKYVEAFAKNGYVGTVGGVNLYTKKDATAGFIYVGTKDAVTLFITNTIISRKYYLAALTDETKVVKIAIA